MASSSRPIPRPARSPESFDSLYKRNNAAEILQSYEKLSWYSFQRCESLTQTRLHFQNIVAGFTEQDEAALVDWKEDKTRRPKPGEEVRKGKDRVSLGAPAGALSAGAGGGDAVAGSSVKKTGREREKSDSGASGVGGSGKKKRKSGGLNG